jgi:uncharacterized membrane protein required for colicin V production
MHSRLLVTPVDSSRVTAPSLTSIERHFALHGMDWLDQLNWMDYALLAISTVFVLGGYSKGFTRQVLQLAGIVAAFYTSLVYTPRVSQMSFLETLRNYNPEITHVATFIGVFIATVVVWNLVVEVVIRWIPGRRLFRPVDGLLGGALGAIKAILVVGGVCLGLMTWGNLKDFDPFRDSVLAPRMAAGCSALVLLIPEGTRQKMHQFNEMVHEELRSRKLMNPGVVPSLASNPELAVDSIPDSRRGSRPRRLQCRPQPRGLRETPRFDPTLAPRPPSRLTGKGIAGQPLGNNLGRHLGQKRLSGKRSTTSSDSSRRHNQ